MQEGGELEDGSGESSVKLIVAYQPPWILSPRDFEQIAGFNKIPMYNSELENAQAPYKSAHRVWGKVRRSINPRFIFIYQKFSLARGYL